MGGAFDGGNLESKHVGPTQITKTYFPYHDELFVIFISIFLHLNFDMKGCRIFYWTNLWLMIVLFMLQ